MCRSGLSKGRFHWNPSVEVAWRVEVAASGKGGGYSSADHRLAAAATGADRRVFLRREINLLSLEMHLLPQEMGVLPLEMAEMREKNAGVRLEIDLLRQVKAVLPLEMTGMAREMAGMRQENGLLPRGKGLLFFWNCADPLSLNNRANAIAARVRP